MKCGGVLSSSDEITLDGDSPFTNISSHPAQPSGPSMSHEEVPREGTPCTLCRDQQHHPPPMLEDSKASSPRPPAPVRTRSPNARQLEVSPLLQVIQGTEARVMGCCSILQVAAPGASHRVTRGTSFHWWKLTSGTCTHSKRVDSFLRCPPGP